MKAPPLYALVKIADVKIGSTLIADGGFDCLQPFQKVTVQADVDGELFVTCGCRQHYLAGQLCHTMEGFYVGFWLAAPDDPKVVVGHDYVEEASGPIVTERRIGFADLVAAGI